MGPRIRLSKIVATTLRRGGRMHPMEHVGEQKASHFVVATE